MALYTLERPSEFYLALQEPGAKYEVSSTT